MASPNRAELLKKLRHIEIATTRLANQQMAGQYRSVFKGRGMSFEEVRPYQEGDDVRLIDWNVSARTGTLHIKVFIEERELTVFLLVDASASTTFGTRRMSRRELIAEVGALLAFSAIKNNDRVGLIIFTDSVQHIVPPAKGRRHVMRVIMDILDFQAPQLPQQPGGLEKALRTLHGITKKNSVAFVLSDFFVRDDAEYEGLRKSLAVARRRHDVVPLVARDPADLELPRAGLLALHDPESGQQLLIDSSRPAAARLFRSWAEASDQRLTGLFKSQGLDHEFLHTDRDYIPSLLRLFRRRARRH